ncbi:MAG: DUF2922 domain-containing protein [Anaerovibrio sp.]|uniref:DUF2922 domain-containing protein n=1 Tax=Anaerovibrio sp. TaxID=1872532 RepID=UPI0025E373A8|nr:DUF2922 domain-containing protein [Anaerovibrio sp.]MCR5175636.1 DUF2922 domain-containing protein [Anaerovibrio sp.]
MKATLVMSFRMSNGKNTTVSITSPKDGLTGAEVNEVAAEMVAKDALIVNENHLEALDKAYIRTVEETLLP